MEIRSLNSLCSSMCHGECSGKGPFAPPLAAVPWGADSYDALHIHTSTAQTNYHAHPSGGLFNILHHTPLLNTAERDAKPLFS